MIRTIIVLLTFLWSVFASADQEFIQEITSQDGDFHITVTRSNQLPVGEFISWILTVKDKQNNLVSQAKVQVGGGMPGHGHGLPTAPRVTPSTQPGIYTLNGLKFSMSGQWEIKLFIESESIQDVALLNIKI